MSAGTTQQGPVTPEELHGGAAWAAIRALDGPVEICDMYSPAGARAYADFVAHDTTEIAEILRRVRTVSGDILELAAGSGRITLPLLALGRPAIAVDLSEAMLALLAERLRKTPPRMRGLARLVQADMTRFTPDRPVGAVVLGTTSLSLLDDDGRTAALARVRDALRPGGRAVITTVRLRETADIAERTLTLVGASGRSYQTFDLVSEDRSHRYTLVLVPSPDGESTLVASSRIGIVPPERLTSDLADVGLAVDEVAPMPGRDRYETVLVVARRAS